MNSTKEKEGVREIIEYCQKESLNYSIFSPKLAEETLNYKQKIELSEKIKESFYLKTFFTVGKDEVRSWLTRKANQARKCAGLIHSDIEKGFIRVKVYNYEEWMRDKKIQERKEKEDYLVKDGDICNFLFNKSKRIN